MTFDEFVQQIETFAKRDGVAAEGIPYCDPATWKSLFEAKFTPCEAWHVERIQLMVE